MLQKLPTASNVCSLHFITKAQENGPQAQHKALEGPSNLLSAAACVRAHARGHMTQMVYRPLPPSHHVCTHIHPSLPSIPGPSWRHCGGLKAATLSCLNLSCPGRLLHTAGIGTPDAHFSLWRPSCFEGPEPGECESSIFSGSNSSMQNMSQFLERFLWSLFPHTPPPLHNVLGLPTPMTFLYSLFKISSSIYPQRGLFVCLAHWEKK